MPTDVGVLTLLYDRLARLAWHRVMLGQDTEAVHEHEHCKVLASAIGDDGVALYEEFKAYHCSGPAFGTERAPMPTRPQGQLTLL